MRPIVPQYLHGSVYPNPAADAVFAKTADQSEFTMTLTDMRGRTLASGKSPNGNASLSTHGLSDGLYIVALTSPTGKVLTTKVSVQH